MNFYKIVRESDQANYDYVSVGSNFTWGRQVFDVCRNVSKRQCKSPGTLCYGQRQCKSPGTLCYGQRQCKRPGTLC